jgi:hypothetical protein
VLRVSLPRPASVAGAAPVSSGTLRAGPFVPLAIGPAPGLESMGPVRRPSSVLNAISVVHRDAYQVPLPLLAPTHPPAHEYNRGKPVMLPTPPPPAPLPPTPPPPEPSRAPARVHVSVPRPSAPY